MKVVIAPDSFKESLSAADVAAALAAGVTHALPHATIDLCPMADGGEGTVDAMVAATGGTTLVADVFDPKPADGESRVQSRASDLDPSTLKSRLSRCFHCAKRSVRQQRPRVQGKGRRPVVEGTSGSRITTADAHADRPTMGDRIAAS